MEAQEVRRHVRVYITVFVALMVLTIVTVGASYIKLYRPYAIAVALLIASVKAGLVASYFMHLISERRLIYMVLVLTGIFLVAVLLLPVLIDLEGVVTSRAS